jgi:uncharacterized membrane protein
MNPSPTTKNRIWEIDLIRGIAIVLMILFHLIVDLRDFYDYPLEYLNGFWYIEGKLSAVLFILICGASSTLTHRSFRHGIAVFLWAMVLTVATYFYNDNYYILFGILHFLGISLLSANFMNRLSLHWLAILSGSTMIIAIPFSQRFITNPYLFPVGLTTNTFSSLDYYPLFPWYGVFLLGIMLGKILYSKKKASNHQYSPATVKSFSHQPLAQCLTLITQLGQHSLAIYLIHQPLLLTLLYLIHAIF